MKSEIADIHMHKGEHLTDSIREFSPDIIGISLRNVDKTDSTHPQGFIEFYQTHYSDHSKAFRGPCRFRGSGLTIFPMK
jgi:predicted MPP superfamily phosphohydrolase